MNPIVRKITQIVPTVLIVIAALVVLRHLWQYYMLDPWTRDAHVSADVVQVAPDVSGPVLEVRARDNAQVRRGDVLFVVDPERYKIALKEAQAALARSQAGVAQGQAALAQNRALLLQSQAARSQLQREAQRDRELKDLVATEEAETRRSSLDKAQAAVTAAQASVAAAQANVAAAQAGIATAQAEVERAQLNLDRTTVRSPVDGRVGDRIVRVGDYVSASKPVLAVLDTQSFRIDGYFEETRLHGIQEGAPVDIQIMGESGVLHGHVQSIAAGIEDRYRTQGSSLLPNVNPAFDWVRLAQRLPVRISLDDVPAGVHLIVGRSVTVTVAGSGQARKNAEPQQQQQQQQQQPQQGKAS
ncbi:MAG: HlyD family secretion protein [Acidovorax sp.]